MMGPSSNVLKDFRDIHLPPDVSSWPPAPGWIILGCLLILVLGYFSFKLIKQWHQGRVKRHALRRLANLEAEFQHTRDSSGIVIELSAFLRRVALAAFPRQHVAGLEGEKWLHFLDKMGNTHSFKKGPGRMLVDAPYQREVSANLNPLFVSIRGWINHCL